MCGTRRPSACVHGVLFSGYRVAKSVHGMHASVHGVADSVHGVADSVNGLPERGHRLPISDYGLPECGDRVAESGYRVTRSGYGAADRGDRRAALSAVHIRLHRYVGGMRKGRILSETALFDRVRKLICLLMPSRTPQCLDRYRSGSCRHGRCPHGQREARTWKRPRRVGGRRPSRGCRRGSNRS